MNAVVRPLLRVDGRVPFLALLQLIHCYLIWAALHDIAQQLSARYVVEYTFLAVLPFTMALLWRVAFSVMGRKGRLIWIGAFAVWVLLLDWAAYDSIATGWTRTQGVLESSVLWASVAVLLVFTVIARRTNSRE